jgi:hypothetical protein
MSFPLRAVRGLVVLLLVVVAVVGASARAAEARTPMVKGLQDTRLVLSDDAKDRRLFWSKAKRAKVGRVRVLASWDGVSRQIHPDNATRLRRAGEDAERAGAKLVVGIYAAINRKRAVPRRISPTLISRFSDFTASIGTALRDSPIAGYLTWNEPNFKSMWPQNQPRSWVRMSNAAYRSFKRTDPGVKVLVGEPAPNARTRNAVNPGDFFRKALCLDSRFRSLNDSRSCRTKLLGDGFAIHTHDFFVGPTTPRSPTSQWTMGNLRTTLQQIRALARAGRITAKASRNVHITEFAYRTHGSARTPDAKAARWLRLAWNYAERERISSFTWYQLQDPGPSEEWRSGMLTTSGRELRTWKTFRSLR